MIVWSEDRIDRLRSMWARGVTSSVIAETFGLTVSTITGKARRLCLPIRKIQPLRGKSYDRMSKYGDRKSDVHYGYASASEPAALPVSLPVVRWLSPDYIAAAELRLARAHARAA